MKRFLLLSIALVIISAGLFATGSRQQSGSTVTTLPPGAKSLDRFTINYFDHNEDPATTARQRIKDFYANVEKLYKSLYPNANLVITGMEGGEGTNVLQMQFASGTGPDVFEFGNKLVPWVQAGYLYDLSDQSWAADVVEAAYPEVRYNGKIYGAPVKVSGWLLYYNKPIYEDQLRLRAPQNFQQFLDNCEAIKRAGYAPLVTGGADGWPFLGTFLTFSSFVFGSNRNFPVDLYNGRASLAGKEINDLFGAIKTLYDRGYFSDATVSISWGGALQHLAEGRAVMMFAPGGLNPADDGYNTEVGCFYIPDYNGFNCLPVVADSSFGVNARYRYASTYGADLIKCLIDDSSLHIIADDSSPVAYKSKVMATNTLGTRMFQEAFNRGPVVMQTSSWIPGSVFNATIPIISSILSGNGFTQQMLNDLQRNYEADKNQINFAAFN